MQGTKYARITTKNAPVRTLFFIYEINDVDQVIYDFRDSLRVYLDKKKVSIVTKSASGTITSSLWNAFEANNLDVNLAMKLADVYAWSVDFMVYKKGIILKYIQELYVDSTYIGQTRSVCRFQ